MALLSPHSAGENVEDALAVGGARPSDRRNVGEAAAFQPPSSCPAFCGVNAGLCALWLTLLAWAWLGAAPVHAQPAYSVTEAGVKAGYLLGFTRYTDWPTNAFTNAAAPLVIGVLGDDPFGATLDQTVLKKISQGRPVFVRRAREVAALEECHAIFICRSEQARLPAILAALRDRPVLTACDTDAFFEQGVMFKFTVVLNPETKVKESVRFEVRRDVAAQAGLKFDSRMLDAALQVWPKREKEGKRP
ncbi:MAG: hypothetical protein RL514_2425 [Verrucomicrobiota bacterium]|jgi:hypothetical protein